MQPASVPPPQTSRDAILDGAHRVMRERGLARTTTKEIARAAGLSEAALYKRFDDRTDLILAVLAERLPRVDAAEGGVALPVLLQRLVRDLLAYYANVLPIGMSIFSDTGLLERHRDALAARGTGPSVTVDGVRTLLTDEQSAGRIASDADLDGVALALVGGCMHQAFLWCFDGRGGDVDAVAGQLSSALLPGLTPRRG